MIEMNVREARGNLSALLDQVEQGEEIVITRRGRKIAVLSPLKEARLPLTSLVNFRETVRTTGKSLSGVVVEEREAGRY